MKKNSIFVLVNLKKKSFGGGFNFLNYLKFKLNKRNILAKSIKDADVILINSHHNFIKAIFAKFLLRNKVFVHRIDGPISKYTNRKDYRDQLAFLLNKYVADATIYQSKWSKNKLNFKNKKNIVIYNSADSRFYYKKKTKKITNSIIISSWSKNFNKGFLYYKYLDENINFRKYKISFVGNSDIAFKNIKIFKPMDKNKLSVFLRKHKLYITASKNDPCSNSLLEAIACGLTPLGLKSGGHPELINDKRFLFRSKKDLFKKIHLYFKNKNNKRFHTKDNTIKYEKFFNFITSLYHKKKIILKKINIFQFIYLLINFIYFKFSEKIKG